MSSTRSVEIAPGQTRGVESLPRLEHAGGVDADGHIVLRAYGLDA